MNNRLGKADQQKMAEYLETIRAAEKELSA